MIVFALFVSACGSDSAKKGAPTSACGNGVLDPGEVCDPSIASGQAGACPASCSASGCEVATLSGNPLRCTARCIVEPVACAARDGCCPIGCDSAYDEAPNADGNCPASCDACAGEVLSGRSATYSARCEVTTSVACVDGDGCCPVGCEAPSSVYCTKPCESLLSSCDAPYSVCLPVSPEIGDYCVRLCFRDADCLPGQDCIVDNPLVSGFCL
ncbi:MAG: hypothetical protein R3E66_09005 [bacterium]